MKLVALESSPWMKPVALESSPWIELALLLSMLFSVREMTGIRPLLVQSSLRLPWFCGRMSLDDPCEEPLLQLVLVVGTLVVVVLLGLVVSLVDVVIIVVGSP